MLVFQFFLWPLVHQVRSVEARFLKSREENEMNMNFPLEILRFLVLLPLK